MLVLAIVGCVFCALLLTTFVVGALRVLHDGDEVADQIDRAGFGPAQFWSGTLQRQPASSSAATQEGILGVGMGGSVAIEQTRTLSVEMY